MLKIEKLVHGTSFIVMTAMLIQLAVPTTATAKPRLDFDGETLYMAVFQGRGEALAQIPALRQVLDLAAVVPKEYLPDVEARFDQLIDRIREADSTFFKRFHRRLTSGNRFVIERALEEAADITVAVVDINGIVAKMLKSESGKGYSSIDEMTAAFELGSNPDQGAISLTFVAVIALVAYAAVFLWAAVATYVAGAIAAAAVVVAVVEVEVGASASSGSSSLIQEQVVDSIAIAFGH